MLPHYFSKKTLRNLTGITPTQLNRILLPIIPCVSKPAAPIFQFSNWAQNALVDLKGSEIDDKDSIIKVY